LPKEKLPQIWAIAPGSNAFFWEECKKGNFIAVGFSSHFVDNDFHDMDDLKAKYLEVEWNNRRSAGQMCPQIWDFFREVREGDIVLAKNGQLKIMGIGKVTSSCYIDENKIPLQKKIEYNYNFTKDSFSVIRDVIWDDSFPIHGIKIPKQANWRATIIKVEEPKINEIIWYLKQNGYNIDDFLKHPYKPKFPDPRKVSPTYIKNKIKSPPSLSKSKEKKGTLKGKAYYESEEYKNLFGRQGELVVLEEEKRRLLRSNRPDLAKKVKRLSQYDDYAGYDIESFDVNGSKRYIEVKSTKRPFNGNSTTFEITHNEVETAKRYGKAYYIYRVFDVISEEPRIKVIRNPYKLMDRIKVDSNPSKLIKLKPKDYYATIYFE